jgi:hypothetical protein
MTSPTRDRSRLRGRQRAKSERLTPAKYNRAIRPPSQPTSLAADIAVALSPSASCAAHPGGEGGEPGALALLRDASETIPQSERQGVYDAARSICVLALLDTLGPSSPPAAIGAAVLGFVAAASGPRLGVLLETTPAREAHAVISALVRAGLVDPQIAQIAHVRVDLRADPG